MASNESSRTTNLNEEHFDHSAGFSTAHKAKLSIPTIDCGTFRNFGQNRQQSSFNYVNENEVERDQIKSHRKHKKWIGIVFTVLSALCFSFTALIAKLLTHLHPLNIGIWTFFLMTLLSSIFVSFKWRISNYKVPNSADEHENTNNINSHHRSMHLFLFIRSFFGVSALILFFYAVKFITVADAIVIDASSPIFVYLMAFIFFGEKLGIVPFFATVLALFGVALIARPPLFTGQVEYNWDSLWGTIFAFVSMLCIATSIIALKFLKTVSHSFINFVFGFWGTIQCALLSWISKEFDIPSDIPDILKIVSIAILFFAGQALITMALQYEDAGPVGLLRTTEVIFVFIWQIVFLGLAPDFYSWCGAILIVFGAVLTLSRSWIASLPETNKFRSICNLLLY